jgi:hypothetical protein
LNNATEAEAKIRNIAEKQQPLREKAGENEPFSLTTSSNFSGLSAKSNVYDMPLQPRDFTPSLKFGLPLSCFS